MGVVAVSGQVASGKTTVARELARELNYRFVSIGELFRRIARERGVSLMELHRIAEKDFSIDRVVDSVCIEEARRGNVVVEGHLAAWILRDIADVKVFLKASIEVRAARLAQREGITVEEALSEIRSREESNRRRYKEIYGIDLDDLGIFDLVIDTSRIGQGVVLDLVKTYVVEVLRGKGLLGGT